ncbi:MAG: hypothetical protein NVS1B10_02150 [Candidatus Saccharimonadales bacterium]
MLHKHKLINKYIQYGGHIELNETPWQALIHEIAEESGYEISQLEILQPKDRILKLTNSILHPTPLCQISHKLHNGHYHTDSQFVFTAKAPPKNKAGKDESKYTKILNRTQLSQLNLDETLEDIKVVGEFIFSNCLINWQSVNTSDFLS